MFDRHFALSTDLYELTMAAAYFERGMTFKASFEAFTRKLPTQRAYLVFAGLETVLEYLETLRFSDDEIAYLRALPAFQAISDAFWGYLRDFRFTGEVWAMPEGTVFFPNEPFIRITAPIIEAQVVETFVLSTLNFQVLIASKAARVVHAAQGRSILEFGSRRAHGSEAALYAARAAYVGGCVGTSNVEAGMRFGIPISGTIAHAFIMAHEHEIEAFKDYLQSFPSASTLLIDTYDTVEAARLIVQHGLKPQAVRLDSGDLVALSRQVRQILDEGGLNQTKIVASNDLDEFQIEKLLLEHAPIDSFGVGTQLATSYDAPALGGVYKLVEVFDESGQAHGKQKRSAQKATYPFSKQVWRTLTEERFEQDVIGLAEEAIPGEPLLQRVMANGQRVSSAPSLSESRERGLQSLQQLPPDLLSIHSEGGYAVRYSDALEAAREGLIDSPE